MHFIGFFVHNNGYFSLLLLKLCDAKTYHFEIYYCKFDLIKNCYNIIKKLALIVL